MLKLLLLFNVSLFPPDITMLEWKYTGLCGVPHVSVITRIPKTKGAELVTLCHEQTVP